MPGIKNTDSKAILTLGDLSSHFAQGADGHILLSIAARDFVLEGFTPAPTPVMTAAQIIAALESEPTIVEVQDMAGNKLGYAIP